MTRGAPPAATPATPALPLAVHVGFAGARRLRPADAALDEAAFEAVLLTQLQAFLASLPEVLGVGPQHFLVGVSQMAIGADMLFSRAAEALGWGHRVLLPQAREDFLAAVGSRGPDFNEAQRVLARERLQAPSVIEERVATVAPQRDERFDDTNLAILLESDLIVCLVHDDQPGRRGGSRELVERAERRGVPVIVLQLAVDDQGRPVLQREPRPWGFVPPALPTALQAAMPPLSLQPGGAWPDVSSYGQALKSLASRQAGERSGHFKAAARVIVGTHVLATLLASIALADGKLPMPHGLVPALLAVELLLLVFGLWTHHRLHHERHVETWAVARLCAEIGRAATVIGQLHPSLDFLLRLPVPDDLRPMLRTLVALHLRAERHVMPPSLNEALKNYVDRRLTDPKTGQIAYYEREQARAEQRRRLAGRGFLAFSLTAIAATGLKFVLELALGHEVPKSAYGALGVLAIFLPVLAVGAMSLAAALDADGRAHVFRTMHEFLNRQADRLARAQTTREAAALVAETESRLLGETITWFARRAYTSIA